MIPQSPTMSDIKIELVDHYIQLYTLNEPSLYKATGRYSGWMLIYDQERNECFTNEIKENYISYKKTFENKGYHLLHWKSLSYDPDDEGEFGLRKGVQSI